MVDRPKRELGKELIKFVDGTEQEITIYAIGNYDMMRLRRQFRKTKLDKKGNIESVDFEDENFVLAMLDLATGSQLSKNDLMDIDSDLKEIFDKYFNKELSAEKKAKLVDISNQEQVKDSQE